MSKKIFLSLLISTLSFGQNNKVIDSLNSIVSTTKNDSTKVSLLNKIAFHYVFSDSKKANQILKQSEKIAITKNLNFGQNEIINIKGIFQDISGNSDSANYYFQKSLALSKKNNFITIEVRSINNLGMYNWNKGNWNIALQYFFNALQINQNLPLKEKINESICFNNIGLIYQEMGLYDNAIKYHKNAYSIRLKDNLFKDQASSLNNIGICYRNKKDYKKAIEAFNKGIKTAKTSNNLQEVVKNTENLASVYIDLEQYQNALSYNLEAEKLSKNIEDSPKEKLLRDSYIAICYNKLKKYSLSLAYCNEALQILKNNESLETYASDLYRISASTNYALRDIEKGDYFSNLYNVLLKKIFSQDNSKHIAELETKYQTAQKEKLILQQQAESKQKNIWLILISSIAIIGFLLFRQQRLKSRQQKEQALLENELLQEQSNFKIQEQRLEISRELHDSVGSQLTFIISILDNLKNAPVKLENAIEKKIDNLSGYANNSISELRDTIWALNTDNLTISELETRILNFVKEASESVETIDFDFKNSTVTNYQLTSKQGINLFRVVQESVNNAVKHSKANKINIILYEVENQLSIKIQDNGQGFDYEEKRKKSYGLTNLQNRIKELNGNFELITNDTGTIINCTIPIV